MATSIYLISGLGADRRAFRKLVFPAEFTCVYLDWIEPIQNDSMESYAARLAMGIDASTPFYLIGLSFGGMLAIEIAKKLKPIHTFLISSTRIYTELPWYYKVAGGLRLQKIVPLSLIKSGNSIGLQFLGGKTPDEKLLLKQLLVDSDPRFIKWALNSIVTWRNAARPENVTHIHGSSDHILPIRYNKPDFRINGGSHFMVYANAEEIMKIIMAKIREY